MADSTVPPTFANAAANALSGGQAPTPAAPVYQAPAPASEPTFFGRILQGALNGLAGGLRSGQENIAGAGTPGFRPNGNGLGYAEQLQQQQDAQKQAAQAQKVQGAQQDFENQQKTFQANQQAQLQQVQATQAKLNGIHLEQQIQHADTDAQDQYYKGQQDQTQAILDGGGKEVAHLKVSAGQSMQDVGSSYLKDNPNLLHDPNTHITYSRDADGETEVHILSGDPNAQVDAGHVNSQLKSIGSGRQIAPGTSMSRHDFNRVFSEESGKVADQHNAAQVEKVKFQQQQALESQRQAGQVSLEKMKEANAGGGAGAGLGDPTQPLQPVLEKNVDSVASGDLTPAQMSKGMGKEAGVRAQQMTARYNAKYRDPNSPDYNPAALPFEQLEAAHKYTSSDKFGQSVQAAGELFGTKKPDGTTTPGAIADIEQKMQRINQKWPALSGVDAKVAAHVMKLAGDPDMEDLLGTAPDIALKMGKFASGGGPGSDSTFKAMQDSLTKPKTLAALQKTFAGIHDLGGETLGGMLASGGQYAQNRLAKVNNPGTANDSKNPSGASRNIGDTVQLKNGKTARIKALLPGGKYSIE